EKRLPEDTIVGLVTNLKPAPIGTAIDNAALDAEHFETACEPIQDTIRRLRAILAELASAVRPLRDAVPASGVPAIFDRLNASFKAGALASDARRYRRDASHNRKIAGMYELQVRRSGLDANRLKLRSDLFFYAMLVAQGAIAIATLALARQRIGLFWLLA